MRAFGIYPQTDAGGPHVAVVADLKDKVFQRGLLRMRASYLDAARMADKKHDTAEAERCHAACVAIDNGLKNAAAGWIVQPPAGVPE